MICNHSIASIVFRVNPLFLECLHIISSTFSRLNNRQKNYTRNILDCQNLTKTYEWNTLYRFLKKNNVYQVHLNNKKFIKIKFYLQSRQKIKINKFSTINRHLFKLKKRNKIYKLFDNYNCLAILHIN